MEIMALLFLLSFSPNGNLVAAPDNFGNVILWDVQSGMQTQTLKAGSAQVSSVAIRPDGKYMVTGSRDGTVTLWDLEKGAILKAEQAHTDTVLAVSFSKDGHTMITASRDGTVSIWTMPEFIRFGFVMTDAGQLFTAAMSPDAQWIAASANDGAVYVWKGPKTWTRVSRIESMSAVSLAFNPSGDLLVSGGSDGIVKAYRGSGDQWSKVREWSVTTEFLNSITFCPDGTCLFLAANYDTIFSLALREDAQPRQLYQSDNVKEFGIWDMAISADGRSLARIDSMGAVRIETR